MKITTLASLVLVAACGASSPSASPPSYPGPSTTGAVGVRRS